MCSPGCAKVLLGLFNVLFFIGGALLLAFGIAGIADPDGVAGFISSIPGVDHMATIIDIPDVIVSSAIFMIVLGSIMMLFGFLGCAGAWCMVKPLLFFYWLLLIVLIIAEVALIIFAAVSPATAQAHVNKVMYESLHKHFDSVTINATEKTVTLPSDIVAVSWVSMQFEVGCCGVENYTDYQGFKWNNTYHVKEGSNMTEIEAKVPPSCCVTTDKNVPTSTDKFTDLPNCLRARSSYHTEGCQKAVNELAREYSYIPIIICCCVIAIEAVCMMAAIYLWRLKSEKN